MERPRLGALRPRTKFHLATFARCKVGDDKERRCSRDLDNCADSRNRALVETLRSSGERKYHRRAWVLATNRVRLVTGVLVDPLVSFSPVSQMPLMSWYSTPGNWEGASRSVAREGLSAATSISNTKTSRRLSAA